MQTNGAGAPKPFSMNPAMLDPLKDAGFETVAEIEIKPEDFGKDLVLNTTDGRKLHFHIPVSLGMSAREEPIPAEWSKNPPKSLIPESARAVLERIPARARAPRGAPRRAARGISIESRNGASQRDK